MIISLLRNCSRYSALVTADYKWGLSQSVQLQEFGLVSVLHSPDQLPKYSVSCEWWLPHPFQPPHLPDQSPVHVVVFLEWFFFAPPPPPPFTAWCDRLTSAEWSQPSPWPPHQCRWSEKGQSGQVHKTSINNLGNIFRLTNRFVVFNLPTKIPCCELGINSSSLIPDYALHELPHHIGEPQKADVYGNPFPSLPSFNGLSYSFGTSPSSIISLLHKLKWLMCSRSLLVMVHTPWVVIKLRQLYLIIIPDWISLKPSILLPKELLNLWSHSITEWTQRNIGYWTRTSLALPSPCCP